MGTDRTREHPASNAFGTGISTASYVLPKRPRTSKQNPETINDLEALKAAWEEFETDVNEALCQLRLPVLESITQALKIRPKGGEVVAVCVKMGAAAVAGDRSDSFASIIEHVALDDQLTVLCLQAANHSSMSTITNEFSHIDRHGSVVVALEDADLFPEDTLRDIVYMCGKFAKGTASSLVGADRPPVALLFGLGTSPAAVHSALGVQEATMIVPTMVQMPHATACFSVIVAKVLSRRKHNLLFTQAIYDMIETEFFSRESTVSMLMRSFYQMFSFHFFRQPLASVFCNPLHTRAVDEAADTTLDSVEDALSDVADSLSQLQLQCLDSLMPAARTDTDGPSQSNEHVQRKTVRAVVTRANAPPSEDELRQYSVVWYKELRRWQQICSTVEEMSFRLLQSERVTGGDWKTTITSKHMDLRMSVFRVFLPDNSHVIQPKHSAMFRNLYRKISTGHKPGLLEIIKVMTESLQQSPVRNDKLIAGAVRKLNDLREQLMNPSVVGVETAATSVAEPPKRMAKGAAAARQTRKLALLQSQEIVKLTDVMKTPRLTLAAIFDELLNYVASFSKLPMYEVMLFTQQSNLQSASGSMGGSAEPRSALFTALRKPSSVVGDILDKQTPDTAIAYRILAEGGRMVNLYDWYNNFATMRSLGTIERDDEGNMKATCAMSDAEMQARFARACSELEFLGVMKYTNRKTDHVLRLVFE